MSIENYSLSNVVMVPALVPGESVLQLIYLLGSDEREREGDHPNLHRHKVRLTRPDCKYIHIIIQYNDKNIIII